MRTETTLSGCWPEKSRRFAEADAAHGLRRGGFRHCGRPVDRPAARINEGAKLKCWLKLGCGCDSGSGFWTNGREGCVGE